MKKQLVVFFFFLIFSTTKAANYYGLNGSGVWSTIAHWTTTAGGPVLHTTLPDTTDDVFIGSGDTMKVTNDTAWCNDLVINGVFEQTGGVLIVFGDFTNNGVIKQTAGKIVLGGASVNTIDGTQDLYLDSLIMDKNGYCDVSRDVIIKNNLDFQQGYLFTYTSSLIRFEPGATGSGGKALSYIIGPVEKRGTESFQFPIGRGGKWARLTISDASVLTDTSVMRAEYFNPHYIDTTNYNAPLTRVSYKEYWLLDRLSGTGSFQVRLHFEDADFSGIQDIDSATVAKYTSGAWDDMGNNNRFLSGKTGWIESNLVSTFSPFTFGTVFNNNSLPASLVEFSARKVNSDGLLHWVTAQEINSSHFEILRSKDNFHYVKIAEVESQSANSNKLLSYSYLDQDIHMLNTEKVFYKLNHIDLNGASAKTETRLIHLNAQNKLIVTPNPSNGNVSIATHRKGGRLQVVNGLGAVVYSLTSTNTQIGARVDLSQLEKGAYMVRFITGTEVKTARIIIY